MTWLCQGVGLIHVRFPDAMEEICTETESVSHYFKQADVPSIGKEVALISFNGESYSAFGVLSKQKGKSTLQRKISVSHIVFFDEVSFVQVNAVVIKSDKAVITHIEKRQGSEFMAFPEKSAEAILEGLFAINNEARELFLAAREKAAGRKPIDLKNGDWKETLFKEKDAIDTSLKMAELDSTDIKYGSDLNNPPISTFNILDSGTSLEDRQLETDAAAFGGLKEIKAKADIRGSRRFHDSYNESMVTIFNVNRHPIETTTGVDLIIHHEKYDSYLMIQYKRMTKDGGQDWICRPDDQMKKEMERMEEVRKAIGMQVVESQYDYRLNDDPFYFKLCRADTIKPDESGMVSGIYILASDLSQFLGSDESRGKKGGHFISDGNFRRRLPNTTFFILGNSGLIGSRKVGTDRIKEYILRSADLGHSVMCSNIRKKEPQMIDEDDT